MTDDISLVRGISAAASSSSRSLLSSDALELPTLHKECWEGLDRMSIKSLFPVQKICADLITKRFENPQYSPFDCDLCISAPTGSGKSLAYILPIIHGLIGRKHPVLRALIVLPTRDLALQIAQVISHFTSSTSESNLKVHCLIGGQTSMAEERSQLKATFPDIAVATIGRLVDHLVIGSLDLSFLRWLVVDEADRMLSKSDLDKWSLILQSVPPGTHRLLFSATMTSNPMKLSKLQLTRPLFVSVGTGGLPQSILHKYVVVPNKSMKVRGLIKLLQLTFEGGNLHLSPEPSNRCLILCRTAANVESLSSLLASFYKNSSRVVPAAFSGNLSGKQREKLLSKFAKGSTNCLVSTDVITRGMDIPDIDTVINYDVPSHCTTYIHRAGRTGRANKKGLVVTLAQSNEMRHFRREILAGDASIKNAIARFPLDFSGLMTHDELEGIVDADGDLLDE